MQDSSPTSPEVAHQGAASIGADLGQARREARRERSGMMMRLRSILIWTGCLLAGLWLTMQLDRYVYDLTIGLGKSSHLEWLSMFRMAGYAPMWALLAVAFILIDRRRFRGDRVRRVTQRAELLIWPIALAGIIAALLKILIRRERPLYHEGSYAFRPFSEHPFDGSGLGMPSSHTAITFAAAYMLYRMYPMGWPIWITFAAGCALSRMAQGSHFLSDTYVGAIVGCLSGLFVWRIHLHLNRHREPAEYLPTPPL